MTRLLENPSTYPEDQFTPLEAVCDAMAWGRFECYTLSAIMARVAMETHVKITCQELGIKAKGKYPSLRDQLDAMHKHRYLSRQDRDAACRHARTGNLAAHGHVTEPDAAEEMVAFVRELIHSPIAIVDEWTVTFSNGGVL